MGNYVNSKKKVMIITNSLGGLYSFRKELIQEMINNNYKVVIIAPENERALFFESLGCKYIELIMDRRSTNPVSDLKLLCTYLKVIKNEKPDIVLTYTIKPNVYGGIACQVLNVPYLTNVTGLGTAVESRGILQRISLLLYRLGLKKSSLVFFQNEKNLQYFSKKNIVSDNNKLIPGSGVNLSQHKFEEYPDEDGTIRLLFVGRLMKAKGLNELLQAAQIIRGKFPFVEFHLVGSKEEDYSNELTKLEKKGIIKYHGRQSDVHSYMKTSHAIINPSYHEGMSNVLLEAASSGRPVLASNVPGCKETFDESISGLSFEAKNVSSLVETITKFINMPYKDKVDMGLAGRKKMELEFDRKIVVAEYMKAIELVLGENK